MFTVPSLFRKQCRQIYTIFNNIKAQIFSMCYVISGGSLIKLVFIADKKKGNIKVI